MQKDFIQSFCGLLTVVEDALRLETSRSLILEYWDTVCE